MTLGSGYEVTYGYASNGRFETLSWDVDGEDDIATYGYQANSELLSGYTTGSGLGVGYAYEAHRDLKTQVQNSFGSTTISQYDYRYDAIGRRRDVVTTGTAFGTGELSIWGYNDRNEVVGSNRHAGTNPDAPGAEVTGERRGYGYDPIGNRESALGQDGVTSISYTPNELNQYDLVGQQAPSYDEDGNLLNDGMKVLAYNAESQLISVTVPGVSVSTFDYDYIGRRVRKSVDVLDGNGPDYEVTWVYSGWNKIEERRTEGSTTTVKNFVWGLDLSQSMEGAGGIGGLLAVVDQGGNANLFAYDGNGNVSELIAADTGSTAAHYEYDAFGNTLAATGTAAAENAYRFSTKYADDETGLIAYELRYYEPSTGRWTQRDPIGERGGLNLYAMIGNNPVGELDLLGLAGASIDDIDKGLLIYSCNCGWIDWGHSRPEGAQGILRQVEEERERVPGPYGTFDVYARQVARVLGVDIGTSEFYRVRHYLDASDKIGVSLAIYMDISDRFESFQDLFSAIRSSGNSEEDRPSNLIGFYRAVLGIEQGDVERICDAKSKCESKMLYKHTGGLKTSTSWKPTDYNAVLSRLTNRSIPALQWPAEFSQFTPAPAGELWWRVVTP